MTRRSASSPRPPRAAPPPPTSRPSFTRRASPSRGSAGWSGSSSPGSRRGHHHRGGRRPARRRRRPGHRLPHRTLLTDLGLLARVQDRRGDICYIAPPIGHSHPLICGVCRRVVRFDGEGDLTELEAKLAAETGFAIYGHHLEVYGICAACRAARPGAERRADDRDGVDAAEPRPCGRARRARRGRRPPLLRLVERRQGRLPRPAARRAPAAAVPAALLCMLHEDGRGSHGHGLPLALLEEQAAALGMPLVLRATTWDDYEATFSRASTSCARQGVEAGVFGDIDLQAHRDWVESVCEVAGLGASCRSGRSPGAPCSTSSSPAASRATIVAVDADRLDAAFLGRQLDAALIADSRPPASTPAARRASTTPWSPRRRFRRARRARLGRHGRRRPVPVRRRGRRSRRRRPRQRTPTR